MGGSTLSVVKGPAQQLSGASLGHGTTVFNTDIANSVWIGSDQTVKPNISGWELTPQMSVNWTGKQLYACLDTGGTAPVIVEISDDVQNINNPVGVAEAIALLGIPNVLVEVPILVNSTIASGNASAKLDVHEFSQLIMQVANPGANPTQIQLIFYDINNVIVSNTQMDYPRYGGPQPNYSIPVDGYYFSIINNGAGPITIYLDGTNRTPDPRILPLNDQIDIQGPYTVATTAAGPYLLGPITPNRSGRFQCAFIVNGLSGYFSIVDGNGAIMIIADTAEMHIVPGTGSSVVMKQIYFPPEVYSLYFNQTAAGASSVQAFLIG